LFKVSLKEPTETVLYSCWSLISERWTRWNTWKE